VCCLLIICLIVAIICVARKGDNSDSNEPSSSNKSNQHASNYLFDDDDDVNQKDDMPTLRSAEYGSAAHIQPDGPPAYSSVSSVPEPKPMEKKEPVVYTSLSAVKESSTPIVYDSTMT
jgi:hypothetical protein